MMEAVAPQISHLSANVISQIDSSKHISSSNGVVFALLENSLDAGSNKVEISVDWPRGGCAVKDDGHGVAPAEFEHSGGLAQIYCTSKRQPGGDSRYPRPNTHGVNGMFLAELASLSLLSITSKVRNCDHLASLTLHHGTVIGRRTEIPRDENETFHGSIEQHGMIVTVRDLFGNMPVRVKQRALAEPEEQKSWHELKHGVLALLLAWPKPCVVRLRDINCTSRVVTLASYRLGSSSELIKKNLSHLSGQLQVFDLRDVLPLLFQSGFASPESRNKWIPLSASTSALSVKGLICLEPVPTKDCQFISIGIHPCNRNDGYSDLYEAVDGIFHNSDFGNYEQAEPKLPRQRCSGATQYASETTGKHRQARRSVDRFPMYYIQITLQKSLGHRLDRIDNLGDAAVAAIIDILEVAVSSWLEKNFFRPRKRRRVCSANSVNNLSFRPHISPSVSNSIVRSQDKSRPSPEKEAKKSILPAVSPRKSKTHIPLQSHQNDLTSHSHIRTGSAYGRLNVQLPSSSLTTIRTAAKGSDSQLPHLMSEIGNPTNGLPGRRLVHTHNIEAGPLGETTKTHSEQVWKKLLSNRSLPSLPTEHPDIPTYDTHPPDSTGVSDTSSYDYGSIDEDEMIAAENAETASIGTTGSDEVVLQWTDPVSKRILKLNPRTGTVLPSDTLNNEEDQRSHEKHHGPFGASLTSSESHLRLARRLSQATQDKTANLKHQPRWLPDFMRSWNNPLFSVWSEEPIPRISRRESTSISSLSQERFSLTGTCRVHSIENSENSVTQLSRAALKSIKVIGQVDKKFILCTVKSAMNFQAVGIPPGDTGNGAQETLVLIDQHAASERVIVEKLLHDYADSLQTMSGVAQSSYEPRQNPVPSGVHIEFDVTNREFDLFKSYRDHFAAWGIGYDALELDACGVTPKALRRRELRVIVKSLPPIVAERCASIPKLCIDLMRVEAWALADGTKKPISPSLLQHYGGCTDQPARIINDPVWLQLVSACPQGMLDLINSRACRSAIMFNDELTVAQCQCLVEDLSACTFPFVCAHGRVSMVPLVQMGSAQSPPLGNA